MGRKAHNAKTDMIGRKFGRLKVVAPGGKSKNGKLVWECVCECGKTKTVKGYSLRSGTTKSCGCIWRESISKPRTHGMSQSKEYSVWEGMKTRCFNPNDKHYKDYGGRGISVFNGWVNDFEAFYSHIGPAPPGATIDRIDNEKGYVPGNVRWVTQSENASNRRSSKRWFVKGAEFRTAKDGGAHYGVSRRTIGNWCEDPNRSDCRSELVY